MRRLVIGTCEDSGSGPPTADPGSEACSHTPSSSSSYTPSSQQAGRPAQGSPHNATGWSTRLSNYSTISVPDPPDPHALGHPDPLVRSKDPDPFIIKQK
jgi:hypothetical protein